MSPAKGGGAGMPEYAWVRADGGRSLNATEDGHSMVGMSKDGGVDVAARLTVAGEEVALRSKLDAANTQIASLEATITSLTARIDSLETRPKFAHFRLPPSQRLTNGFTGGWNGLDVLSSVSLAWTMRTGIAWGSRTAEEQALLTAMGRDGVTHLYTTFNVYKLSWSGRASSWIGPWAKSITYYDDGGGFTSAAFIKVESGSLKENCELVHSHAALPALSTAPSHCCRIRSRLVSLCLARSLAVPPARASAGPATSLVAGAVGRSIHGIVCATADPRLAARHARHGTARPRSCASMI